MKQILTKPRLFIGLMSGTSLDGVDAVLADFSGVPKVLGHVYHAFSASLRADIASLLQTGPDEIEQAGRLSVQLAACYAAAVRVLLSQTGVDAAEITAIGAHGQTVRHRPALGFTVQLNHPALLAEKTGITVVADFRNRDIAAGGQGAPLVPALHAALWRDEHESRVVLNIGGIANISYLPAINSRQVVRGWDTGPGNTLMDAWILQHQGAAFDAGGAWGAAGQVSESLLRALLNEPYFALPAPKSTGRELFHLSWLTPFVRAESTVDVQATLCELTAVSIADAIRPLQVKSVWVCGGGVFNAQLMRRIHALLPAQTVQSTANVGVDPMQVEALAFAWLAMRTIAGMPGNLPAVTGARSERVLGAIYPA
jgi:anhydro-N-acetylmuramic acid kinase